MSAIDDRGQCIRCRSRFGEHEHCRHCGVHKDRIVRKARRRKIGGKRGRNSGKVSQHGKKG